MFMKRHPRLKKFLQVYAADMFSAIKKIFVLEIGVTPIEVPSVFGGISRLRPLAQK